MIEINEIYPCIITNIGNDKERDDVIVVEIKDIKSDHTNKYWFYSKNMITKQEIHLIYENYEEYSVKYNGKTNEIIYIAGYPRRNNICCNIT